MGSSPDPDCFDFHGPTHIMGAGSSAAMIDWGNEEYRMSITACLVKATYVLENDEATSCRAKALAPAWYESFGFRLKKVLTEDCSKRGKNFASVSRKKMTCATIFGAIYEYVPCPDTPRHRHPSAAPPPRYVVAFRGTMPKHANWEVTMKDLDLDLHVLFTNNNLEHRSRSKLARGYVDQLMDGQPSLGPDKCVDVWLAGHSLGASLALDVGRYMMDERELNLPTFLFNPPHVSLAPLIKLLPAEKAKRGLYYTSYFFKVGTAVLLGPVFGSHWKRMTNQYERLSPWVPNLYVNQEDIICQGFIDYFDLRQEFEDTFRGIAGNLSAAAKTVSFRNMLFYMLGKLGGKDKERLNLLSSVTLWKNAPQSSDGAHDLKQWWKQDVHLKLTKSSFRE